MDDAEIWVRAHVTPTSAVEVTHERPWSTVARVPTTTGRSGSRTCAPVQAFEARLSAELSARWPDRVAVVLAHDVDRRWLLLADAGRGSSISAARRRRGSTCCRRTPSSSAASRHTPTTMWRTACPTCAWQSCPRVTPSSSTTARCRSRPPTARACGRSRRASRAVRRACSSGIGETIQHDDLHMWNVYGRRVLDWGDSSVAHPFFSLS
jgi:hypothetical protein